MSSLEDRIRVLSKAVGKQGEVAPPLGGFYSPPRTAAPQAARPAVPQPSASPVVRVRPAPRPAGDPYRLGSQVAGKVLSTPGGTVVETKPPAVRQAYWERTTPRDDQQLGGYFPGGGLPAKDVPLRHERHLQRRKALFTLLFLSLLLFALLFYRIVR